MLVAVQSAVAERPGVLPAARALSHFGEHSLGWLAVAALGAWLVPARRRQYVTAVSGRSPPHGRRSPDQSASFVVPAPIIRRSP